LKMENPLDFDAFHASPSFCHATILSQTRSGRIGRLGLEGPLRSIGGLKGRRGAYLDAEGGAPVSDRHLAMAHRKTRRMPSESASTWSARLNSSKSLRSVSVRLTWILCFSFLSSPFGGRPMLFFRFIAPKIYAIWGISRVYLPIFDFF